MVSVVLPSNRLEPALGKVDHVARQMVHQVGKQQAERRSTHGPAVDEQHVGPAADLAMGDLTGAHVEHAVGRSAEQIGGVRRGERGHGNLQVVAITTI